MKKCLMAILFLIYTFSIFAQAKRILIVSTNIDSVGDNQSGTYLMEIAYPFQTLTNNGYEIDIVTPKGGKAAIYHSGTVKEDLQSIRQSALFIGKTTNTLSPENVNPKNYVAVFYPGGHGQYFDVMADERIENITASIYEQGGIIGRAGHGVASLFNIRLKNNKYLVSGKRITAFPVFAEKEWMKISRYGKLLPFEMTEVLKRRGADLVVCTKETIDNRDLTHVIDEKNRMITGAFASSAQWVSEEMVKMISKVKK